MPKTRELIPIERARIVTLRELNWTKSRIAKYIKCSPNAVSYTLKNHRKWGELNKDFKTIPRRGRTPSLDSSAEYHLKFDCVRDPRKSIAALTDDLNMTILAFLESFKNKSKLR